MAGIWNRVFDRGEGFAPLASETVWSCVYLVGRGVFTGAQARDAINATLPSDKQLTLQEITDFNNILTAAALGSATAKLDYMLRLRALLQLVEIHLLSNEATFRSELGLP
jgi:hypothetical protein